MKKHTIFITATNTDIGKTYTTLQLINYYSNLGFKVGVYKPIETGVETTPLDGNLLLNRVKELNCDFTATIDDIVPYQFKLPASPYVAKKDTIIDKRVLYTKFKKLKNMCDILLIEGAGGLLVPIEKDFFMIDLIKLFDAKTLLVSSSKLGSINDTLLSINLLNQKKIDYVHAINLYLDKDSFKDVTYPYYFDNMDRVLTVQNSIKDITEELLI